MENKDEKLITTKDIAKILGISRIAVFKKIKNGDIKARKVGRKYIISQDELNQILGLELSEERKTEIEVSVKKTIKEYGEALRMLGKE